MHTWRERYDVGLCLVYWIQLMGMKLKRNSYEIAEIKWHMARAVVYLISLPHWSPETNVVAAS